MRTTTIAASILLSPTFPVHLNMTPFLALNSVTNENGMHHLLWREQEATPAFKQKWSVTVSKELKNFLSFSTLITNWGVTITHMQKTYYRNLKSHMLANCLHICCKCGSTFKPILSTFFGTWQRYGNIFYETSWRPKLNPGGWQLCLWW